MKKKKKRNDLNKNKLEKLATPTVTFSSSFLLSPPERPGLQSPKPVEDLQSDLIEALRLDLIHNHPKDRLLLPKLLLLIPDLLQIVEEFCENLRSRVFDATPDFAKTKPLLREIFDLCC